MAAGSTEVTQSIENIASVSEENSAAVEEVSASAEEMTAQVQEVTASAVELSQLAADLRQVVAQFTLAETPDQPAPGARSQSAPVPPPAAKRQPSLRGPERPAALAAGNGRHNGHGLN
jgi:methyl-accepting chemotaxis protein